MPESQRWLATKGKFDETKEVLKAVYEQESVEPELKSLKNEVRRLRRYIEMSECERYSQLFSIYKKCLMIGCSL